MNTLELDASEVILVETLRRLPAPKRAPVARPIDQLLELAAPHTANVERRGISQ